MQRILVIEDDDQVRMMLRMTLEGAGYEVDEASNGKHAFSRIAEKPPALVITDIIMPEKEGLETIAELRRDFPWIRLIAVSGGGRLGPEDYLDLADRLGADRIFVKPVDREDLLSSVRELLEASDAEAH